MSYKSDFESTKGWNAVDTNIKLTGSKGKGFMTMLKNQGVHTIIRYYASSQRAKTISKEEAQLICDNGFNLLPVYQDIHRKKEHFGHDNGVKAGRNALSFVDYIGQPEGTTILFAVDENFAKNDVVKYMVPFFEGVNAVIDKRFRIGCYGSGTTLTELMERGLIEVPWITMSQAFYGTEKFFYSNKWAMRQIPPDQTYSGSIFYDMNFMEWSPQKIGAFNLNDISVPKTPKTVKSKSKKTSTPKAPAPPIVESPSDWGKWIDGLLGGRDVRGKQIIYNSLEEIAKEGEYEELPDGRWLKIGEVDR